MKFCAILPKHTIDRPGGAELQAQFITEELASRGHDVYYIAHEATRETKLEKKGVEIRRLQPQVPVNKAVELVDVVKEIDPDVCYFRILKDTDLLSVINTLTDVETVFNVSHDAQCLNIWDGWPGKKSPTPIHSLYRRANLFYQRLLLNVPDYVFAQTDEQARLLGQKRDIVATVTGNGHPVPENDVSKADPPIVLWLASIKRWKQPKKFIQIAQRCSDLDCKFQMVGQISDEELGCKVKKQARKTDNLEYVGPCSIEESNEFIARATVFVNTSRQEGFPNTFLQSWMRNTVVASLHADPNGLLSGENLGVVTDGDLDKLVGRIRHVLVNDDERQKILSNSHSHSCENYDIQKVVDSIESTLLCSK